MYKLKHSFRHILIWEFVVCNERQLFFLLWQFKVKNSLLGAAKGKKFTWGHSPGTLNLTKKILPKENTWKIVFKTVPKKFILQILYHLKVFFCLNEHSPQRFEIFNKNV